MRTTLLPALASNDARLTACLPSPRSARSLRRPARGAAAAPAKGFFGVAPQTGSDHARRPLHEGGRDRKRAPAAALVGDPADRARAATTGRLRRRRSKSRPAPGCGCCPRSAAPPRWVARKATTLPIDSAKQRAAWTAFLKRRGRTLRARRRILEPRHGADGVNYEPAIPDPMPIRDLADLERGQLLLLRLSRSRRSRYAKLVTISSQAIKAVDPSAKVDPRRPLRRTDRAAAARGMPAAEFLDALYRTPGIKSRFDGDRPAPLRGRHRNAGRNGRGIPRSHGRKPRPARPLHHRDGLGVAERLQPGRLRAGHPGQVTQLRGAYGYLLENQRRLNLKQVYWFSWKDLPGSCNFCDSVGLFRAGPELQAQALLARLRRRSPAAARDRDG